MSFLFVIVFIILGTTIYFIQKENHERRIHEQVEAIRGKVISIERRSLRTGTFILVGKGRSVYWVEYEVGGQLREGWVKFGGLFGPDWRL